MIQPTSVFKDNLVQLPAIDDTKCIDLVDGQGVVVTDIGNRSSKQGPVTVYHYLQQTFDQLDVTAAEHGLAVLAEHTIDARNRPGAHLNVNRLLTITAGEPALCINIVKI